MNSSDVFNTARKMKHVQRLSGTPTLLHQDLASHCYYTGLLFMFITEEEGIEVSKEELEFVFLHDVIETKTGDLLWPAKHAAGNNALWDQVEANVVSKLAPELAEYTDNALSGRVAQAFRYSDSLELMYCCKEELLMGNKSPAILEVIENLRRSLETASLPSVRDLFTELDL